MDNVHDLFSAMPALRSCYHAAQSEDGRHVVFWRCATLGSRHRGTPPTLVLAGDGVAADIPALNGLTLPESPKSDFGVAVASDGAVYVLHVRSDTRYVTVFSVNDVNDMVLRGASSIIDVTKCVAFAATPRIDGVVFAPIKQSSSKGTKALTDAVRLRTFG